MKIAIADDRKQKVLKNTEMSIEEFSNKLKNTVRTDETMEEYLSFPKERQDNIKDVGGFVGGYLKNGSRKKENVISRSIVTLDMDYGRKGILDDLEMLFDFKCVIYSTHKHTRDNPRYRIIIFLSREVTSSEYEQLSFRIGEEIGKNLFDDTTYEANRLMYWPSTCKDGEFVFKEIEGKILDVDFYLNKEKENNIKNEKQYKEDPLTKKNIVGAFCRAYSVSQAIDKFLPDVYKPSTLKNRYDYILGESSAGLVIYNDKFAYSHHNSDPVKGKCLNAFDLVRLHKFNKDEKNSFDEMCKFIVKDEKVKLQLIKDKGSASDDFSDLNWQSKLDINKKGKIKDTLDNLVLIMENDENLKNIAFNLHKDNIDVVGKLPWKQIKQGWSDSDNSALKVYLSENYNIYSNLKTRDALIFVASTRAYHPIKQYLEKLPPWDKIPRVENLLIDYFNAENSSYVKAVTRKTLVAAVARIYDPGVKFDSVLILNGQQGIGKSTIFQKLGKEWFSDSLTITDMKDKSAAEKLQGFWILELGELAGMRKMEVEIIKSFLSRSDDKYRASYGVSVENHPRQCVIVGSTNAEGGFLRDITGNRRFWPVIVYGDGKKKPWEMTNEEVEQIWAETLEIYKSGEKLYLEGEDNLSAIAHQANAMESDEREGLIRQYLNTLLPTNWSEMNLYDRRNYLRGDEFLTNNMKGSVKRDFVCNMEIWAECFFNDPAMMKASDSYEISAIMKKIENWEKCSDRRITNIYGRQRGYKLIEVDK